MTNNLCLQDQLIRTTARIEAFLPNGTVNFGTGFFFKFPWSVDDREILVLVTNRHVVAGAIAARLQFTLADDTGGPLLGQTHSVVIQNFADGWVGHPSSDVDLAAIGIGGIVHDMQEAGKKVCVVSVTKENFADDEFLQNLTAIEDVLMIGYPSGLWDTKNNLPLVRRGITATPLSADFCGRDEFVIDCACVPGSSGSPVFLCNIGSYANRSGGLTIGSRMKFVGVLYAGPQMTVDGNIEVVPVPTTATALVKSKVMINLGYCIKAGQLQLLTYPLIERAKAHDETLLTNNPQDT